MVLETEGLSKRFRVGRSTVEAVRGVDLRVEAGEIFGFLGPNGAGKTTTLRMLATLLAPDGGRATVVGCDLRREPARVRRQIGYVGQAGGVDTSASARENLILQARLYGLGAAAARRRAAELIEALELGGFADRAGAYSGGQRRRLDLALGLVHRPALLYLDEPTTGLDPQARARLWEEVRRLRADGTAVFLTTHYLDEADALCDRVAIIDGGRIVAEGTPATLKRGVGGDVVTLGLATAAEAGRAADLLRDRPGIREARQEAAVLQLTVERGEVAVPLILRALDGAGLTLSTLALARPTLDDVFLRQTGRSLRDEAA